MAIAKVIVNGVTKIDASQTTVTPSKLLMGETALAADGTLITGTYEGGGSGGAYTEEEIRKMIARSSSFTDFTFPSGLTSIGNYAFAGLSGLAITSLPSSVTHIGDRAFYNCSNLALTSLPSGITSIGSEAFYNCSKITLSSLPSNLNNINGYIFYGCSRVTFSSLPSGSYTTIGSYAFYGCTGITISTIPSNVTTIGNYAFGRCRSITSISTEAAITSLASYAFYGSSTDPMTLTSVSFPNMNLTSNSLGGVFGSTTAANACQQLAVADIGSVNTISSNAFANCYALQILVLRRSDAVTTLSNVNAFLNTPLNGYNGLTGTVYVPNSLIESYKTASNWSTLYSAGTVNFVKIEGSAYDRS